MGQPREGTEVAVTHTTNERDKSHIVQINLNAMKLFSGLLHLADGTAITHFKCARRHLSSRFYGRLLCG